MRSLRITLALAAVAVAALGPSAFGQSAKPEPGCFPLFPDKKGDSEYPQLDITGWWFATDGTKVTANMRIDNLSSDLPAPATGISWYMLWNGADGAQHFVTASVEVGDLEPQFSYGTVNETGPNPVRESAGDTPGQFIEGPDGVISIEIPTDIGGSAGETLKTPIADTARLIGVPGVISSIQPADDASGKTWTVGPCAGAAATPPAGGPTRVTPPPGSGPAKNQLDVTASTRVPRAKKVKRSLSITVTSANGITDLDGVLFAKRAGGSVVGKGAVASLKGRGKLKLKLSKRIKKGKYVLYLVGRNADGTHADRQFNLKFK